MWVAGADGCPAGWLVVFRSINGQGARAQIFEKITEALAAPERPAILSIDIPIGLPTTSQKGGRLADIEARKVLNLRKSSIFPAPSRSVLNARSFPQAKRIEARNSRPAKKLAKQTFNLLPKIRELYSIALAHAGTIFECHPEVSFWVMNRKAEMSFRKKTQQGFGQRCEALCRNGFKESFLTTRVGTYKDHNRDDLVDACAAVWTAGRILRKQAIRFPATPDLDGCGIDMAIWA
jgi:predicted RNase H-like nuclease